MIENINIVGSLIKGRVAGARNAVHRYLALLHVPATPQRGPYTRYLYEAELAQVHTIVGNYHRRGVAVTLELSPTTQYKTEAELISASREADQPRGASPVHGRPLVVIDPFAKPKPQTEASNPDLTAADPANVKAIEARKVLEERVANFDPDVKIKVTQLGRKKDINKRADEILDELSVLDEEATKLRTDLENLREAINVGAKEGKPTKALRNQYKMKRRAFDDRIKRLQDLKGELATQPMGWRRAEADRLKALWKWATDDEVVWDKESKRAGIDVSREEYKRRLQFRMKRLRGTMTEVKPAGAEAFGIGQFTKIGAFKDFPDVEPATQPMGYLLTDGWHTQKEKGGETINFFTANERDALVDEYQGVGERMLWGKLWKQARIKGWFTQFPGLAEDEDFKQDLKSTITATILNAGKKYTPTFAAAKLDEGVSFPMYVRASLIGELKNEFKRRLRRAYNEDEYLEVPKPGEHGKTERQSPDELVARFFDDDEADPGGVVDMREHHYVDPEEHAIVREAEAILARRLSPEQHLALMSKLNVHDTVPKEKQELKTNREVAEDLRDRFGGSISKWESKVGPLIDGVKDILRDERKTKKFPAHERAAVAAGMKIIADVLAQRKSDLFHHSWRRSREAHQRTESVPEPRLVVVPAEGKVAEKMAQAAKEREEGTKPMTAYAAARRPHVAFWSQPDIKPLSRKLAVFLERKEYNPKTGYMEEVFHPFDIRHYSALPGTKQPTIIGLQDYRMRALHRAYQALDKLTAAQLRADMTGPLATLQTDPGAKVKVKGATIYGLSADELRTLSDWLAEKKEAKKSLLAGNALKEAIDYLAIMISTYEDARARLSFAD